MQQAKEYSNQLCREYGLSFTESKADSVPYSCLEETAVPYH